MNGHDAFISKAWSPNKEAAYRSQGHDMLPNPEKGERGYYLHQRRTMAMAGKNQTGTIKQIAGLKRNVKGSLARAVVGKSYIPTKGYKPANQLSAMERKIVGAKASGKTVRLRRSDGSTTDVKRTPNRMKNAPSAKGKKIYEGFETPRGKLTKVVASRHQTGMHQGALTQVEGFSQPDGRGGGRIVIHDDADFKKTAAHELQHILPRRNPHRFFERAKDPVRLGREEGRADFMANGKPTPGQYPGSAQFKSGYNEVQNKMASAKGTQPKKRGLFRRQP